MRERLFVKLRKIVMSSIKWLYSIVFVFVFVVIFLSFSVIQSYHNMSTKYFFECQIAVSVLIIFPTKLGPTHSGHMGHNNEFNLLSLNVRGIRTFEKRKAVFSWLVNSDADIFFLSETYSIRDIENIWRKQWKGEMFFSHGSNHSRGVLIPIRDNLDFKIHSTKVDSQGRYIFLEAYIHDSPYFPLNIYARNKCSEKFLFFKDVSDILKGARVEQDHPFIVSA